MKYWVARDKRGECCLYEGKPTEDVDGTWNPNGYRWYKVSPRLFPNVTFDNSPMIIIMRIMGE